MSDYYQPTLLFRQNAIRRSPYSSPRSSESSLDLGQYQSKNPSWILNPNSSDTELLNKICSLDRLNIKSNYWKIPDNEMNLTSMAVKTNGDLGTLAISSGNQKSNLFIYELDMNNNCKRIWLTENISFIKGFRRHNLDVNRGISSTRHININ